MDKQNSTPSHFCADLPFKIQYETKNSSPSMPQKKRFPALEPLFFAIYLPAYFPRLAKAAASVGNIPAGILHIVCPVYYNGGVASRKVVRRDLLALRKAPKRLAVFGICQVGIVSGSPQIIVYRRAETSENVADAAAAKIGAANVESALMVLIITLSVKEKFLK